MKILELTAENVKRLKVVQIRPNGPLVELTGKNGAGKTSVLDAIWWALAGVGNVQRTPIRRGAEKATIRLNLGEIVVMRTFGTAKDPKTKEPTGDYTTTLVVEDEKGLRYPSPQKLLEGLLGELSFDPLAFTRLRTRDQFDELQRFVPGVDFDAMAKAQKADFDERTAVNRRAKELRAQLAGVRVPSDAPASRVDAAALIAKLDEAGQHNSALETRRGRREQAEAESLRWRRQEAALKAQADEHLVQIQRLRREAAELIAGAMAIDEKLAAAGDLPAAIDTSDIRQKIAAAAEANDKFDRAARAAEEQERLTTAAQEAERNSARLTAGMADREEEKRTAIAAAQMPVEGLTFGDGEILLNGVPFDQASDAEQLRTSIAIAMAANPKLRVIRVRDGSLLDADAMALLEEMAAERDYQVWIECVESGRATAIHLVDGEVRAAAAVEASP